jgi:hypothetical protein
VLLQQLVNGLMLGSTYSLIAIGYALIFVVLGLAHRPRRGLHDGRADRAADRPVAGGAGRGLWSARSPDGGGRQS